MRAINAAAAGLKGQQARLDTIANNIANSDTAGYKSVRVDFKDALYSAMDHPLGNSEARNLFSGNGVLMGATTTDFSDGTMITTGETLDFSLSGNGFFTVQDSEGGVLYTRSGSFQASVENGNSYLVTAQGYYVLDRGGNRIRLPNNSEEISVNEAGELDMPNGTTVALAITSFSNPDGLESAGDTCYRASEDSGTPIRAAGITVKQGILEQSNVELAQEMTLLIRSQRSYSLASKALQTADDMQGLANNIR